VKVTREKRSDKIEIGWRNYTVRQEDNGDVYIYRVMGMYGDGLGIEKKAIPQLIKALQEITK